jgi:carboxyl-terminal processing protease
LKKYVHFSIFNILTQVIKIIMDPLVSYIRKRRWLVIPLVLLLAPIPWSCKEIFNPPDSKLTNEALLEYMKEWYLWYDTMPDVSANKFSTQQELLDTLMLKPTDRWSCIQKTSEYNDYYSKGIYTGHGIGLRWDSEGKLKVGFIFDDSDLQTSGVTRGWEVTAINGNDIVPGEVIDTSILGPDEEGIQNSFTFRDLSGGIQTLTSTKKNIDINAILHSEIIEIAGKKVGYFVFQSFTIASKDELTVLFSDFLTEDIDELIIDLRYNSGGMTDVSLYLGNLFFGRVADKGAFLKFVYNDKKSDRNVDLRFKPETNSIIVPRVFFITTRSTASASEVLINSIKPYVDKIDMVIVGDTTHGKPVGMIAKQFTDYTLVPITYFIYNRDHEGEFFEGLPPDYFVADDLDEAFGSPEENCLKEVLYFIENGTFSGKHKSYSSSFPWKSGGGQGAAIGAI